MQGPGRFEDAVVVCIRDNPEPVVFKVACDGFRPELELDKKVLHFDKVLLHRSGRLTLCSFLSVPSHLKASFWEGGAIAAPPPHSYTESGICSIAGSTGTRMQCHTG